MSITAGVDASYDDRRYGAALVVFQDDETWEVVTCEGEVESPYVSGLFFLREAPVLSYLLHGRKIDLLFVNGHGICHPYFFGLATVVGWTHGIRTIGVASRLIRGPYETPSLKAPLGQLPQGQVGISAVTLKGQVVGAAIRLKEKGRLVFISPGFGVSIGDAIRNYMDWIRCGKAPEPLRLAHLHARALLRKRREEGGRS